MNRVKMGVIGIGAMGSDHAANLFDNKVEHAELTAVCDISPERQNWAVERFSPRIQVYGSADAFFENADVDAVIIATPHYDHPPLAIRAFEKGLHVLVEKPAGVYTQHVLQMNEAARQAQKVFAIMLCVRTSPVFQKARELIRCGELGTIKRTIWNATNWYRTQAYYNSSSWRATWAGEGGGVLLNQCPHTLDMWQWLLGMPERVRAFMSFGKMHDIEVEDDVTAYLEYPGGATGVFIASTHDYPGVNRLEISGEKGLLIIEDNERLTFFRNRESERVYNAQSRPRPETWRTEIPLRGEYTLHKGIMQNFVRGILFGEELLAPGEDGLNSLMLSNAMHLSAWDDCSVELGTMDAEYFKKRLDERIQNSALIGKVRK